MFRNYLKLAFRNLSRQKAFSIINIAGLAIGLASSFMILLWVQDELSYDRFHSKANRTYRLIADAGSLQVAVAPAASAPAIKEQIPGVEATARLKPVGALILEGNNKKFEEKEGYYVEPSFFDVFDFKLLSGEPNALNDPRNIFVTEDIALKFFGTTDVVGKTLRSDGRDEFTIAGIIAKPEGNSHLKINVLFPWAQAATWDWGIKDRPWGNFNFFTFVTFDSPKDEAFLSDFEEAFGKIFVSHETSVKVKFDLQPLTDIHLHSRFMADVAGHGNFQYVAALSVIAVFIILIGCINFMNLSTARSARRAKEVGLRKVAGAVRIQLIKQFLGESLLVTVLSLAIALIIVVIALPIVNNLVSKDLSIDIGDPMLLIGVSAITIMTGIISGLYPAFILSGFTPIKVLKKDIKSGAGGSVFRNVLVVAQFVISIVLLVGTSIVYQQLQFLRSKDIGYAKDNLIYLDLRTDMRTTMNKWRAAFESHPETRNFTISDDVPTNHVSGEVDISWPGKDPNQQTIFANSFIDEDFIPVFGIQLAAGRNFNENILGDSSNFIINETAAKIMGFTAESAVGQKINKGDTKGTIVGVVKDFNFKPLREMIEPMIMVPNTWGGTVIIKAEAGKLSETIAATEQAWNSIEDVYPFTYGFVDQDLENLYRSEKQVSTLFSAFALLAIFISCLGLYGLSAFIAEQRTREIGIRKALGASISGIVYLLATRFVIPVVFAMIIAAPLAWYSMVQWLNGFAYKIDFNWMFVVGAGILALCISLATVSFESIKAARVNPVKSLRTE